MSSNPPPPQQTHCQQQGQSLLPPVPNPMAHMTESEEDSRNKRTALAGQWRTPPTAFFSANQDLVSASASTSATVAAEVDAVASTNNNSNNNNNNTSIQLPGSAEDYAKALQEAYRRGAEAAARAAAQQAIQAQVVQAHTCSPPLPAAAAAAASAAVVVPDLQSLTVSNTSTSSSMSTSINANNSMMMVDTTTAETETAVVRPPPLPPVTTLSPRPRPAGNTVMAAPPPAPGPPEMVASASAIVASTTSTTTTPSLPAASWQPVPVPVPSQTTSASAPATSVPQPQTSTGTTTVITNATTKHQQRSVSLPDMSSYAAQQEEDKRQKRLARNRASARLRRLRKKNLVDAYETEVHSLEQTLTQLQQHVWGATSDPHALAEALSMDRGQELLTGPERTAAAAAILQQQTEFLQQLEDVMREQYVLQQVAAARLAGNTNDNNTNNNEWNDLAETLQLTDAQCQQLVAQQPGWNDEWNALQTVQKSLQAMQDNHWLWNEGCSVITDQFLQILHKNQISKYLLWTDHNAETIEHDLDGVHAVNAVPEAPVFQFGIDSNPNELLEDEKAVA